MGSETYHEPYEELSAETREMHRAVVSLMEELEAVDWYQQRADACQDPELRDILLHNKDEEIEHGMMTLEWLRRRDPVFDREMRKYLFTEGPITTLEERLKNGEGDGVVGPAEAVEGAASSDDATAPDASLRVRSLR